ncbi:AAA family ATPase [Sphingopyxis chilensis]|uniref:AAA family ATPase n=1 Tax=Sphingopyxis chilensis TaxID=180400 RepID=UPI002DDDB215|nr:AAA family ATPase [Sphingopyxis chilensis]
MYQKIVIRNVGVLKAFDAGASPPLSELSLFYARNGRGKSTLTAVMRAARDGCSTTVMARRSLGNNAADPEIVLVSSGGSQSFKNGRWAHQRATIEVFDSTFIADNIFAGEMTELDHDRGLFSVIIGEDGVRLANLLRRFNGHAKNAATRLKDAETALQDDLPTDINQVEFFALAPNPAYAQRLDKAEKTLKAVQQSDKLALLASLDKIALPALPSDLHKIMAATVPTIDAAARARLAEHFRHFKLGKNGEAWVNFGLEHIEDDACPFCGRENADELGFVTLYGQIFGEEYKNHMTRISEAMDVLDDATGDEARSAIIASIAQNAELAKKWGQYIRVDADLPGLATLAADLGEAHANAKALLERKRSSPLEIIEDLDAVAALGGAMLRAETALEGYNVIVDAINLASKGATAAATMSVDAARQSVINARRRIARTQDPGVQRRVDAYLAAKRSDERAKKARTKTQAALKAANEAAADHYHLRVNHYLGQFGVGARITRPTNSMAGNAGQADYALLIRGEQIVRGRGRVADAMPSFRNTLSTGDKTTLALAFFLAKLDHDGNLASKVVVFDDPLSSHDSHRRGKTVEAIKQLCGRCLQLIVLSHDEYFLRDVEKRCAGTSTATYQIDYSDGDQWSDAKHVRLSDLCASDHTRRIEKLASYSDHSTGDPDDVVLHVRQVLETHFRRSYTAYFPHNRNLGKIVRDIDSYIGAHPLAGAVRDKLDFLNASTCDNHHGDDAEVTPKKGVDSDELKIIVTEALELIGARRPPE